MDLEKKIDIGKEFEEDCRRFRNYLIGGAIGGVSLVAYGLAMDNEILAGVGSGVIFSDSIMGFGYLLMKIKRKKR